MVISALWDGKKYKLFRFQSLLQFLMENFTPYSALFGGILIGLSATLLLLFNGNLAGISGILSRSLLSLWRILFLFGLVYGAFLFQWIFSKSSPISISAPVPILVAAGVLVGFGTRLGSGCTSGHGVCGIARFSKRSVLAVILFMTSGMITVYFVRFLTGGLF